MNRLACLLIAVTLNRGFLSAAARDESAMTRTTTEIVNGKVVHKVETTGERNLLPPVGNLLEQEKRQLIPNSGLYHSSIRWQSSDAAAIGQDVAVSASGSNTFVGWNLNNVRASFHDSLSGTPLWESLSDPNTYRTFVALSATANIVANASYNSIFLYDKSSGTVTFNFAIPSSRIGGPIAVSRDGQLLVCATMSPITGGTNRVYAFSPPSTTPIWTFDFSDAQSSGVAGINLSIDKTTVAVNGRFYGWILNANNGSVRTSLDISNTESRLAISSDASVLAIAENSGFVKAYSYNAGQSRYNLLWQYRIPPGLFTNWASSVDVSADGLTIAAGSLIFVSGSETDGAVYQFDTFGEGTPAWIRAGLGDLVDEIAISDDGSLIAAVTWGDLANTNPDIYIFERNSNTPVYGVNTPGSMFSLAMSADGKTIAAGGKAVHARTFGSGGNVYNIGIDLGGGAIAGTVTLGGAPPNHGGTTVQVLGTTRSATTIPNGQYIVSNIPPGSYSVRISRVGYVGTTLTSVSVTGTDTTRNVNATLPQAGAAPTNLVASHGLNSRIQLNWTNPVALENRMFLRPRAVDDVPDELGQSFSARQRRTQSGSTITHPSSHIVSDIIPPDSIRIYRAVRTGGPYYLKRTLAGSLASYVDSSAIPLKDYYYRVTALYGNGESAYSNEAYGTVDSSFLQFAFTTPHRTGAPTIDGVLTPGEWTDAIRIDVSDVFGNGSGTQLPRGSVFMWFKYDSLAHRLYIAGEDFLNNDGLATSEGFGLYFDDNNNNRFEAQGTDPLLREGNYWAYYFSSGSTVRFREIFTGGGVTAVIDTITDAQVAFSNSTGHLCGEVSIPIGFFNKNHLQVFGPNKIVGAGLFMIGRDGNGGALFHGWWPQTMVNVFDPITFGDIHIPIRLLAPPKAPGNVTVTRQGSMLRVTWSDPTEGINNDPLTVPATLQLWRNGELWREFPAGIQAWTDSNVVPQGWYEYKLRGYINVDAPPTNYFGPYSASIGAFAVSDPQLTEVVLDDGIPDVFYVVDFTYDGNKFGIRYTPVEHPARVYRVKAFTNNGNKPILVSIHADSLGYPGELLAGPYPGASYQTAGVDSFLVTIPANEPPTINSGSFHVVLNYLPTSPDAPGIGGDVSVPVNARSAYFTTASGWIAMPTVDLMIRAFITGQPLAVEEGNDLPREFALLQNYPNPFNPKTNIKFQIPRTSFVALKVFDVLGREVVTLVNEEKEPGNHSVVFDASRLGSGVYFYRLSAGAFLNVKKLLLLK